MRTYFKILISGSCDAPIKIELISYNEKDQAEQLWDRHLNILEAKTLAKRLKALSPKKSSVHIVINEIYLVQHTKDVALIGLRHEDVHTEISYDECAALSDLLDLHANSRKDKMRSNGSLLKLSYSTMDYRTGDSNSTKPFVPTKFETSKLPE